MSKENEKVNNVEEKEVTEEIRDDIEVKKESQKEIIPQEEKQEEFAKLDDFMPDTEMETTKEVPKVDGAEKKISFNDSFMANLIDVLMSVGISFVLYLVLDAVVLRILGYRFIKEYRGTGFLIVFSIVSILYPAISQSKNGRTIGEKYCKFTINKEEN
ncbi:RDD family protein [Clostridium rectalis]|uniref:RDD family protein n=1 Tax=Clostridium rectalis TaxID=2040295 RepID=UPI0013DE43B3|nr:RDD family protein [Clostridium rectalis]